MMEFTTLLTAMAGVTRMSFVTAKTINTEFCRLNYAKSFLRCSISELWTTINVVVCVTTTKAFSSLRSDTS